MMRSIGLWVGGLGVWAVGLGALGPTPATAQTVVVQVTLGCPATISPGQMLNLSLAMVNQSGPGVIATVAKSAVSASLANNTVLGPYVIPLSATLAPGATATVANYITVPFPDTSRGTFSTLVVVALDSANKVLGGNACLIEIQ